ncbi:MAG: VanZ family protein [Pseudomonadota bacterium]
MRALRLAPLWWCGGFLIMGLIVVGMLLPDNGTTAPVFWFDKAMHFTAFGGLTGWYCGLVERRHFWLVVLVVTVFAAGTEWLQGLLAPTRVADWHDFIADLVGAGAAVALSLLGADRWSAFIESRFGLH